LFGKCPETLFECPLYVNFQNSVMLYVNSHYVHQNVSYLSNVKEVYYLLNVLSTVRVVGPFGVRSVMCTLLYAHHLFKKRPCVLFGMFLLISYNSENKHRYFSSTAIIDWYLHWRMCVCCNLSST